jgi:MoaA/NifB/PqqE/SkfB family radical SAM enzyme
MLPQSLAREMHRQLDSRPRLRSLAKSVDLHASRALHTVAGVVPRVISPHPRQLTIAITAQCNLRCQGCRYGRDFMPGHSLSLAEIRDVLDDAKAAGVGVARLYGGEPLLHPDLAAMVRHATEIGLRCYITSNGTHLGLKMPALYEAGLRQVTIGFYGIGDRYDDYTQRRGHFARLERSLQSVRDRYGRSVELQLNFVLLRDTCNLADLAAAWAFAKRFDMFFHVDLVNFSVPFFVLDRESGLHLAARDRPRAEEVAVEMVRLKRAEPDRFLHTVEFLRSIPDWLIKGADMRVPCDAYELLWIGADGTVQLCDAALPLGNIRERRLRDIMFTDTHRKAAQDGFRLNCPNCTCKVQSRIQKHAASMRRYAAPLPGEGA